MTKIRVASLFSGVGGFEEGLYQALGRENMDVVFSSEIDPHASKAYSLIHGHTPHGDITKIPSEEIPKHDLLVAGFPCQSFSISGKRLGFEDEEKGTLFFEIARIIKHHRTPYILLENVKGLLSHDKGNTWEIIKNTLTDLGYTLYTKVLNSKDYNVPQNRERIYIVASLVENFTYEFPEPYSYGSVIRDILEPEVEDKFYLSEDMHKRFIPKSKNNLIKQVGYIDNKHKDKDLQCVDSVDGISRCITVSGSDERKIMVEGCIDNMSQTNRVYSKDGISCTLRTCSDYKIDEGFRLRRLTPLECMRVQSFPDFYYTIPKEAGISNTQIYKMAGNAVSPNVIREIIRKIDFKL